MVPRMVCAGVVPARLLWIRCHILTKVRKHLVEEEICEYFHLGLVVSEKTNTSRESCCQGKASGLQPGGLPKWCLVEDLNLGWWSLLILAFSLQFCSGLTTFLMVPISCGLLPRSSFLRGDIHLQKRGWHCGWGVTSHRQVRTHIPEWALNISSPHSCHLLSLCASCLENSALYIMIRHC